MNVLQIGALVVSLMLSSGVADDSLKVAKVLGPKKVMPGEQMSGSVVLTKSADADRAVVVQWRDTYGRIGGRQAHMLTAGQDRLDYTLELTSPIAKRGRIEVVVDDALQVEHVKFDVLFPPPAWDDYIAFVWAHYPQGYYGMLRDYGINGGMLYRTNDGDRYHDNNFPVYIDQMGWEIFAYYHKRRAIWEQTIAGYGKDPRDWTLTIRRPSLSDERSFLKLRQLYGDIVSKQRDYRPLFYNLADEIGFGDQSGATDFCWDYSSRDEFRNFLMATYGEVSRLNEQWDTDYATWAQVRSFHPTTYSQYDRLHRRIYLPRDFAAADSDTFVKTFGSAFPSFDKAIALYADLRTSQTVDEKYVLARYQPRREQANAQKIVGQINESFGCAFESIDEVVAFYAAYDKWSFGLKVDRDRLEDMKGWNLSPWMDFREYMDRQMADGMARAVAIGKEFDPDGRFGFTGTHHPGVFRGHTYAKLCPAVDLILPYNIGNTPEIVRSLNPDTCYQILPTWKTGNVGVRDIWTRLLHGDRGIIFWDNEEPKHRFIIQPDKTPTERATSLGPTLVEIESGLAKQLLACRRENNGIAVYYSHPSIRVDYWRQWLGEGRRWVALRSWHLYKFNQRNVLRSSWYRLIEDLNLQYDVVSSEQAVKGRLLRDGYKVLILPEVFALSQAEAGAIQQFAAAGGVVIADRFCGIMDQHGKRLETPQLAGLWETPNAHLLNRSFEQYSRLRMKPGQEVALRDAVGEMLSEAGIKPAVRVISTKTKKPLPAAEVHVFDAGGGVRLVGITRSIQLRQEGIGGTEKIDNSIFEQAEPVELKFDRPVYVYDQRAGQDLGRTAALKLDLDPWSPPILVLADEPLKPLNAQWSPGKLSVVRVLNVQPDVTRAAHVELRDPSGRVLRHYGGNVLVRDGVGKWVVPLAINDPPGTYTITCRDVLTGQTLSVEVEYKPGA